MSTEKGPDQRENHLLKTSLKTTGHPLKKLISGQHGKRTSTGVLWIHRCIIHFALEKFRYIPRRPGFSNFLFPSWDSWFLSQMMAHQVRRPWTRTRTSAMTIRSGTRDSQIQDDEDVDVLRSSDCHWNMPSPFSPISPLAQFGPIFPTWPNFPAFGPISLILLPHIGWSQT